MGPALPSVGQNQRLETQFRDELKITDSSADDAGFSKHWKLAALYFQWLKTPDRSPALPRSSAFHCGVFFPTIDAADKSQS